MYEDVEGTVQHHTQKLLKCKWFCRSEIQNFVCEIMIHSKDCGQDCDSSKWTNAFLRNKFACSEKQIVLPNKYFADE